MAGLALDAETLERLRERVEAKDGAGVREVLAAAGVAPATPGRARGADGARRRRHRARRGASAFDGLARRRHPLPLAELRAIVDALVAAGLGARLAVDLGEVRGLDYYTGLVFRAYARGLGFEVGSGGRYDTLLARFGRPLPAVGFMFGLDRLALLARPGSVRRRGAAGRGRPREPTSRVGSPARPRAAGRRAARVRLCGGAAMSLTVALSKGKLLAGTEALFRAARLPFPEGRGPQARGRRRTACASCS